jgi:hypothetical protein
VDVLRGAPTGPLTFTGTEVAGPSALSDAQVFGTVAIGTVGTPPSLSGQPVMAAPIVTAGTVNFVWSGLSVYATYPANSFSYGLEITKSAPAIENNTAPDPGRVYAAATQSLTGTNGSTNVTGSDSAFTITSGTQYWGRSISWSDWSPSLAAFVAAYFNGVFAASVPFTAQ